jgi:hypothetical protein
MSPRPIEWLLRRKAFFAIVVPYIALSVSIVTFIGVYNTRTDQIELELELQAIHARERAEEIAEDTARELAQSCLDRLQARRDADEILLTIAASLPPRTRDTITALVRARAPLEC